MRHRQAGEERRAEHDDDDHAEQSQRVPRHRDAQQRGDDDDDDAWAIGPDPGGERLAGHERRARRRRDEELGEDAGVALPDDLDAVEDRDEQRRLGDDARREEVEVGDAAGRDGADPAERLCRRSRSHSDGWIARVTSSVRSWRSFCSSTRQNVPIRDTSSRDRPARPRRSAQTAGGATGARTPRSPPFSSSTSSRPSPVWWRKTSSRLASGPERGLELVGEPTARRRPRCMQGDPVAERVGLLHVVGGEQHGHAVARRCICATRSQTLSRATGSRPTVGSSSTSSAGRLTSACASSRRRTMPPE